MQRKLIGKKYIPHDNSYSKNLTNPFKDYILSGNNTGEDPKECIIVSEIYNLEIECKASGKFYTYVFIDVEFNNDTVRVLFKENNVNAILSERIERNRSKLYPYC